MQPTHTHAWLAVAIGSFALAACGDGRRDDAVQAVETAPPPVAAPLPARETETDRLAEKVVDLGGTRTNDAITLTIPGDRFATGRTEFQAGDRIDAVATLLKDHPQARLMVEVYTDDRGGNALNQRLSERRAKAFQQALVERGIDASRIEVAGRGAAQPVASNDTAEGRAQNRRIELTFSAEGANRVAAAPAAAPGG